MKITIEELIEALRTVPNANSVPLSVNQYILTKLEVPSIAYINSSIPVKSRMTDLGIILTKVRTIDGYSWQLTI